MRGLGALVCQSTPQDDRNMLLQAGRHQCLVVHTDQGRYMLCVSLDGLSHDGIPKAVYDPYGAYESFW